MYRIKRLMGFTLGLLVASCAYAQALQKPPEVKNSNLSAVLFHQLLVSELSAESGDIDSAFSLMLDAARRANSEQLYERAVGLSLSARNGPSALMASQAWAKAFPASREANRYVIQILIGLNRIPEALEPLKKEVAVASVRDKLVAIALIPRYFARATDKKAATTTVEQALQSELSHVETGPLAWAVIGQMRLIASDSEGALQAAKNAAKLNPMSEEPAALALNLISPDRPAAEAIVKTYLAGSPTADMRMAYTRKLLDAQRYPDAYAQMLLLTGKHPDYGDGWLVRGSLELQDKRHTQAEASLKKYVDLLIPTLKGTEETPRGLVQAYLLLAEIEERKQQYDAGLQFLQKIKSSQDIARIQTRKASLLARQGKVDEARALIRNLPESQPEDARMKLNAEVQLLRDHKRFQEAHQLLGDALARFPGDTDLAYDKAMVAEKIGALDEMERLLRGVIAAKPDAHYAYNALGYSLADRNIRLPEAIALIKKALAFAPLDPYIVDSLAWAEFRSGRSQEALRLLRQAFAAKPDAEIAAHLGEVLWSMGQQTEAQEVWTKGLGLNAENETLLETMKRLKP
ncbi:tetratricopeptide repeat protein [Rhodoferax aquaticus]|uniref:Tetratricopeptide repeat protein n=1 Tax=Rhodoferax aquaticus TaxID=2527691 RepID=A0A515ELQ5_9BURK|nr:tetratricopeptide repeat protein [Rhodoferax aquaticus]QDL53559.1 tetratricopeptide repeat protein [Rhodoferax aquaticus]